MLTGSLRRKSSLPPSRPKVYIYSSRVAVLDPSMMILERTPDLQFSILFPRLATLSFTQTTGLKRRITYFGRIKLFFGKVGYIYFRRGNHTNQSTWWLYRFHPQSSMTPITTQSPSNLRQEFAKVEQAPFSCFRMLHIFRCAAPTIGRSSWIYTPPFTQHSKHEQRKPGARRPQSRTSHLYDIRLWVMARTYTA